MNETWQTVSPNYLFIFTAIFIVIQYVVGLLKGQSSFSFKEDVVTVVIFTLNYFARSIVNIIYMLPIIGEIYLWKRNNSVNWNIFKGIFSESKLHNWPFAIRIILLFIIVDFGYYLTHRWAHKIRIFWAAHFSHHTITSYNILAANRDALMIVALKEGGLFVGLPLILGFGFKETYFMFVANSIYATWLHQKNTRNIPYIGWLFVTPSHHRVHHSITNLDRTLNVNFGGVLIIWDRIFGTFLPEKSNNHVFGITGFTKSSNFFWSVFYEWKCILSRLYCSRSLRDIFSALFWEISRNTSRQQK